jgi:hypothetical protein
MGSVVEQWNRDKKLRGGKAFRRCAKHYLNVNVDPTSRRTIQMNLLSDRRRCGLCMNNFSAIVPLLE